MSGWSGGPGGSDPRSEGWDPQRPGGTDPWGRPVQGGQPGQPGQPGWGQAPAQPGAPTGQPPGWQTQSTPGGQPPNAGQPAGWQTQTGSGQGRPPAPNDPYRPAPPPGWGPPPGQQPPPGWGQQPPPGYGQQPPPGYGRPPAPGQVPPGWGQQPPPGYGQQPGQGQIPTWAQPQQGAAPPVWARGQGAPGAPPPGWGQPPAGPSSVAPGWGPPAGGPDPDAFPVRLIYDESQGIGNLWGIPLVGVALRVILLIPHFIVLWLLGILTAILIYVTWIPVLLLGRQASFVYAIVGGYLRWTTRLSSYVTLLTSGYPPFSLSGQDDYRVRVEIDQVDHINRFWGIPVIGIAIRSLILIPHYLLLMFVGVAAAVLLAFAWVPVLLLGRQASVVYTVAGGWMRWSLRVYTYLLLLHDSYPPFSLGNEEADRYR